jgi:uncharacterized membrane protein
MEETRKSHHTKGPWLWVLLSAAILLTAVWLFLTPSGLLGKADAVGYSVCHRIEERSFHIGDRPVPLCARCSGLFLGAMLGLVFQVVQGRKGKLPPLPVAVFFGLLALAWALDGVNSFLMLTSWDLAVYQTQNWTRLVTGTGMGMAISIVLLPSFYQTVFHSWQKTSAVGSWQQVLILVLLAAALDAVILLEIPFVLYPLALISAAGVVVLLTMIYSMVVVLLFKADNTYTRFSELALPLLGGYIIAMLQIGLIDLARFLMTGTWSGFSIL